MGVGSPGNTVCRLYMELKKSIMEAESEVWLPEAGRQHGMCRSENTAFYLDSENTFKRPASWHGGCNEQQWIPGNCESGFFSHYKPKVWE